MNGTRVVNVVALTTIVVLLVHAGRALVSQKRWVTAVIEVLAAAVMAWQLYLLASKKEPLGAKARQSPHQ